MIFSETWPKGGDYQRIIAITLFNYVVFLTQNEGMNDVTFTYDGQQLKGVVNGAVRQVAFTGKKTPFYYTNKSTLDLI